MQGISKARPAGFEPATCGLEVCACDLDASPDDQRDLRQENGDSAARVYAQGCALSEKPGGDVSDETGAAGTPPDADFACLVEALSECWETIPEALRPIIGAQILALVQAVATK